MKKTFIFLIGIFLLLSAVVAPRPAQAFIFGLDPATAALVAKEYGLDGIAWAIANRAIDLMAQDIINWINSGFKGRPAFVQNLGEYLLNAADDEIGRFLQGTQFGFMCEPFQANLKFAIELHYLQYKRPFEERYECRLSDVVGNVEEFIDGNFARGGLDQFFEVTVVPQNNPYILFFDARMEIDRRIAGRTSIEQTQLGWSGGFFSNKICTDGGDPPDCEGYISTPGVAIQNQLNRALGFGQDRLLVADEIDEIISALLNQLVTQALGGQGGLLGVSQASARGGTSYFQQTGTAGAVSLRQDLLRNFQQAREEAQTFISVSEDAIVIGMRAQTRIDAAVQCYEQRDPENTNLVRLQSLQRSTDRNLTRINESYALVSSGLPEVNRLISILENNPSEAAVREVGVAYNEMSRAGSIPLQGDSDFMIELIETFAQAEETAVAMLRECAPRGI